MKKTKKTEWMCEHCGGEFFNKEEAQQHEDERKKLFDLYGRLSAGDRISASVSLGSDREGEFYDTLKVKIIKRKGKCLSTEFLVEDKEGMRYWASIERIDKVL